MAEPSISYVAEKIQKETDKSTQLPGSDLGSAGLGTWEPLTPEESQKVDPGLQMTEPVNPVQSVVKEHPSTSDLIASHLAAEKITPEQAAENVELSTYTGVPISSFAGDPAKRKEVVDISKRKMAYNADYSKIVNDFPGIAKIMADPNLAVLAKEDLDGLNMIEWMGKSLVQGVRRNILESGINDLVAKARQEGSFTKYEPEIQKLEKELEPIYANEPKGMNLLYNTASQGPNWLYGAGMALRRGLPMAGAFAAGAFGLGQLGPQVGLPEEIITVPTAAGVGFRVGALAGAAEFAYHMESNSAYRQYMKLKDKNGNPIDPAIIEKNAHIVGLVNAGLEVGGDIILLKTIGTPVINALTSMATKTPAAAPIAQIIMGNAKVFEGMTLKKAIIEAGKILIESEIGEVSTEYLQEVSTGTGQEASKRASGQPFERTGAGEILQQSTAVISPVAQAVFLPGMFGGGSSLYNFRQEEMAHAKVVNDYNTAKAGVAKDSKILDKSPAVYEHIMQTVNKQNGTETAYIPAEDFVSYFQSKNIDPIQAAAELGVDKKAVDSALETGTMIAINDAKMQAVLGKTEHLKALVPDITTDPSKPTFHQIQRIEEESTKQMEEAQTASIKSGEELIKNDPVRAQEARTVAAMIKDAWLVNGIPEGKNEKDYRAQIENGSKMWGAWAVAQAEARHISVGEVLTGINLKIVDETTKMAPLNPTDKVGDITVQQAAERIMQGDKGVLKEIDKGAETYGMNRVLDSVIAHGVEKIKPAMIKENLAKGMSQKDAITKAEEGYKKVLYQVRALRDRAAMPPLSEALGTKDPAEIKARTAFLNAELKKAGLTIQDMVAPHGEYGFKLTTIDKNGATVPDMGVKRSDWQDHVMENIQNTKKLGSGWWEKGALYQHPSIQMQKDKITALRKELVTSSPEERKYLKGIIREIERDIKTAEKSSTNNNKVFEKIKDIYGVTNDITKANFILPDGSLIPNEYHGARVEHSDAMLPLLNKKERAIAEKDMDNAAMHMIKFLEKGAIRVSVWPNEAIIHISTRPTAEQYRVLSDYIRTAVKNTKGLTVETDHDSKEFPIGGSPSAAMNFIRQSFHDEILYQTPGLQRLDPKNYEQYIKEITKTDQSIQDYADYLEATPQEIKRFITDIIDYAHAPEMDTAQLIDLNNKFINRAKTALEAYQEHYRDTSHPSEEYLADYNGETKQLTPMLKRMKDAIDRLDAHIVKMENAKSKPEIIANIDALIHMAHSTKGSSFLDWAYDFGDHDRSGYLINDTLDWLRDQTTYYQTPQMAPTFFNKSERIIQDKMPETATVDQVKGILKNVKQEERQWLGIDAFLEGKTKVSKQELLDHIRANDVKIEEVMKSGTSSDYTNAEIEKYIDNWKADNDETISREQAIVSMRELEDQNGEMFEHNDEHKITKFSKLQEPGGQDYKELLLTLPFIPYHDALKSFAEKKGITNISEAEKLFKQETGRTPNQPTFIMWNHYAEENILAHIRFNTHIDDLGRKILFIEELQSDWHQEGRKFGYMSEQKTMPGVFGGNVPATMEEAKRVPDAPFKKTWHEMALRRMVRYAAENGFDMLSWTTGEQQNTRYDLSKQVQKVYAFHNEDGTWSISLVDIFGNFQGMADYMDGLSTEKLPEVIGKELAAKIIKESGRKLTEEEQQEAMDSDGTGLAYEGLDLKIEGQGMKGFYDKMIPDYLNKFGKPWGARVEQININTDLGKQLKKYQDIMNDPEQFNKMSAEQKNQFMHEMNALALGKGTTQQALEITPDMRRSALQEGFTLFQTAWHGSPHDFEQFTTQKIGAGEGAQVYGWGLYFASEKEVAKYYKDRLGGEDVLYINDKRVNRFDIVKGKFTNAAKQDIYDAVVDVVNQTINEHGEYNPMFAKGYLKEYLAGFAKDMGMRWSEKSKKEISRILRNPNLDLKEGGVLYEVKLKPRESDYLDLDKPLYQQSPKVKKAILSIKNPGKEAAPFINALRDGDKNKVSSQFFYAALARDYSKDKAFFEANPVEGFIKLTKDDKIVNPEAASRLLLSLGIPGIKYLDQASRAKGKGSYNYVIFDDSHVEIKQKYYQDSPIIDPQGATEFRADETIIRLFKSANKSTFMHESGHIWLKSMHDFVLSGKADEAYMNDWKTLSDWLGIKEGQKDITVEQHEQFARGFEAYLMEGNAPSEGLRRTFKLFRNWLTRIYMDVRGLNVALTNDVRAVMDRMLAAEDEIAAARDYMGYADKLNIKGLDPKVMERIGTLQRQAHEQAVDQLTRAQMHEISEERAQFRDSVSLKRKEEILLEVSKMPIYRADERIRELFGNRTGRTVSQAFLNGELDEKGITNLESIAEAYGYTSADQMAKEMVGMRSLSAEINSRLDDEIKAMFPDLKDTAKIKEEAEKIVHSEKQLDVMSLEKQVFEDLLHKAVINEEVKARRAAEAKVAVEATKAKAKALLAEKNVKEASAFRVYYTAERNAAIDVAKALARGDWQAAADAKNKQMMNHALAMEAIRINRIVDKWDKYLTDTMRKDKELFKREDHFAQAAALLERFGYARTDFDPMVPREPLQEWAARMDELTNIINIPAWLMNETIRKEPNALTFKEMGDVVNAIKNIQKVANFEKRAFAIANGADLDVLQKDLIDAAEANVPQRKKHIVKAEEGRFDHAFNMMAKYFTNLKKTQTLLLELDGFKDNGKWFNTFWTSVYDAANRESDMMKAANEGLVKLWSVYSEQERKDLVNKRVYHEELGDSVSKMKLLVMALNLGNADNKQKLFNNRPVWVNENLPWNEATVMNLLQKNLDARDWNFVQGAWDLINTLWPEASNMHRELTGFTPGKVDAVALDVVSSDGKQLRLPGGYYPLKQDPNASLTAAIREEQLGNPLWEEANPAWKSMTNTGYTKERTQAQYPIQLDITVLNRHLRDVIHDIAFRPTIIDLKRVIRNNDVQMSLRRNIGPEGAAAIRQWVAAVASGNAIDKAGTSGLETFVGALRRRASIAVLMLRPSVILQNFSNPFLYSGAVEGFGREEALHGIFVRGLADYIPKVAFDWRAANEIKQMVYSKSAFMRDRRNTPDYSLQELHGKLFGKDPKLQQFAIGLFAGSDELSGIPMWLEAYNKKLNETGSEADSVLYADTLIDRVLGSGRKYDVAGIARGGELARSLSMFYNWFNTELNRWVKEKGLVEQDIKNLPRFAGFVASRILIFNVLSTVLSGQLPKKDDDKLKWWLKQSLRYPMGFFPGVREIGNVALDNMLGLQSYGYKPSPVVGAVDTFLKATQTAGKALKGKAGPQDVAEDISHVAAYAWPYPDMLNNWFWNAFDYLKNGMRPSVEDIYRRRSKRNRK